MAGCSGLYHNRAVTLAPPGEAAAEGGVTPHGDDHRQCRVPDPLREAGPRKEPAPWVGGSTRSGNWLPDDRGGHRHVRRSACGVRVLRRPAHGGRAADPKPLLRLPRQRSQCRRRGAQSRSQRPISAPIGGLGTTPSQLPSRRRLRAAVRRGRRLVPIRVLRRLDRTALPRSETGPKARRHRHWPDPGGEHCRSRPRHYTSAQISWSSAIETKNSPDSIHSCQCVGTTAKWITAAPSEAIAARRAASLLSVFFAALGAISSDDDMARSSLDEVTSHLNLTEIFPLPSPAVGKAC